ncbi:FAD/FMN-containing dehydrogenase [Pseudomonas duriflava]|uniref:FAD/FMN-containing dehydrogenase n=1 Tax=Pseudomonas duriflava TaxID=459528 RepID=A0A562QFY2_9PSED|nr:FAD-binding oxidoreductase [Pseudomonas duriflava]TWI55603.1 FAD/FMN-containing dehydrogenase [Pseudomonas duriflava]
MNLLEQTLATLRYILDSSSIVTGGAINPRHHTDWSHYAPACPGILLLPRTTEEVSKMLRICNTHKQPVVPQGGMTGLAGGGVPRAGDIALSLERMEGIEEIDPAAATMTVLAGTRLETIQQAAAEAGFLFPLNLGARGSCQIGGNIATNAGGNSVIRYGMTRDLVLGLEVVLADGRVLNLMNKMMKNNTGYDLKQCFIGSEGTLGVITRAVLKLHPLPGDVTTVLCAPADYSSAVRLLRTLQRKVGTPQAYEVMWPAFYRLGVDWSGQTAPLPDDKPIYVLFESTGSAEALEALLADAFETGDITDAVIASSHTQARQLWKIREATGEFPVRLKPLNFDISLPIGEIDAFIQDCQQHLDSRFPGHHTLYFGHIGDSNLHVTVDLNSVPEPAPVEALDELVYTAVGARKGSVSAEHGIGALKRDYLHHSVTPEALEVMRQLKQTFDPNGILNPGKVLG